MIEQGQKQSVQALIESNKKELLVLEGRCNQYTVNAESKLSERINTLTGKYDGVTDLLAKTRQEIAHIALPQSIDEVALKRD